MNKKRLRPDTISGRKRKALSLEVKRNLVIDFENGIKVFELAQKYNLHHSTVTTVLKQKDRILEAIKNDLPLTSYLIRKRHGIVADMEIILKNWCDNVVEVTNAPLDRKTICNKAREIFEKLKKDADDENKCVQFIASNGWFFRFKKRWSIHHDKPDTADSNTSFREDLKNIIEEAGFTSQTVFNVRENTMFWKRLPKKMIDKEVFQASEEHHRLTIMLGSNASGDCKLKPLLVYDEDNPKVLQHKSKAGLPVIWKSNSKARVTATIFEDWFGHHFIPEIERYCVSQNIPVKVLLLIDSSPGHPPATLVDFDPRVKVVYLPSTSTSLLQPMDQGVMKCYKAYYFRRAFGSIYEAMNKSQELLFEEFWDAYNILDAIRIVGESWYEFDEQILKSAWKNVCPFMVSERPKENIEFLKAVNDIIYFANQMNTEINFDDVNEFLDLDDSDLPNNESDNQQVVPEDDESDQEQINSMTAEKITTGLDLIENGIRILEEIDSNEERIMSVRQKIQQAVACYYEILQEKNFQLNLLHSILPSSSDA